MGLGLADCSCGSLKREPYQALLAATPLGMVHTIVFAEGSALLQLDLDLLGSALSSACTDLTQAMDSFYGFLQVHVIVDTSTLRSMRP